MKTEIAVRTVTITPEKAAELLKSQGVNRKLSKPAVTRLADDLAQGRWVTNGESIKIDTKGRLVDGQHRLAACVRTGKPLETIVITGLPSKAIETIDQGRTRLPAHVLQILYPELKDPFKVAAVCRLLWQFEKFGMPLQGGGNYTAAQTPTRSEMIRIFRENPGIYDSIKAAGIAHGAGRRLGQLTVTLLGTFHYLANKADATRTAEFFEELRTGGERGSVVRALVNRLQGELFRRRTAPLAVTIKAWNAYVAGEKTFKPAYRSGESFPDIAGRVV